MTAAVEISQWQKTVLCITEGQHQVHVTIVTIVRRPGRNRHLLEGVCLSETVALATSQLHWAVATSLVGVCRIIESSHIVVSLSPVFQ